MDTINVNLMATKSGQSFLTSVTPQQTINNMPITDDVSADVYTSFMMFTTAINFLNGDILLTFFKKQLNHSSKIKSPKEVTKQQKSRFFLLFLRDECRIWIRIRTSN